MQPDSPLILLAEDNLEMLVLLTRVLERDGYRVLAARTGADLLALLAEQLATPVEPAPFALIVADLHMPGLTGLEILAGLRAERWTVPFILITAFPTDEVHREAQRLGAAAVLDKPFELDLLSVAVGLVLADAGT